MSNPKNSKHWMVGCVLKYSVENFFAKIDMDNEIYLKNRESLYNAKFIQKKVHQVLTQLCDVDVLFGRST